MALLVRTVKIIKHSCCMYTDSSRSRLKLVHTYSIVGHASSELASQLLTCCETGGCHWWHCSMGNDSMFNCIYTRQNGTIAHEVGHAIGFWHEQSRPDRDDYILIHKHNVTAGKLYNFDKRTWGEIVTLNIPYDLGSDMHYGSKVTY